MTYNLKGRIAGLAKAEKEERIMKALLKEILWWTGWAFYAPAYVIGYLINDWKLGFRDGVDNTKFGGGDEE